MQKKNIIYIAIGTILILLIPLLAMQFTSEVNWNIVDFVVAGILLFGAGLTYQYFANTKYKISVGIAVTIVLILIWLELAVGIFGTSLAGS